MSNIFFYFVELPFVTITAFIGYLFLLLMAFNRSIRGYFLSLFAPYHTKSIPLLDTLRGLSALFVCMFHTWQWLRPFNNSALSILPFITQGNKGVPIFAALSGLVIYRTLIRYPLTIPNLHLYFVRRFKRIYPLYFFVVLAAILLGQMRHDPTIVHGILSELTVLQILGFPYFSVLPTWSLYVELCFYIFLPFFLIFLDRKFIFWTVIFFFITMFVGHSASRSFQLIPFFAIGIIAFDLSVKNAKYLSDRWIGSVVMFLGVLIIILDMTNNAMLLHAFYWLEALVGFALPFNAERGPDLALGLLLLLAPIAAGYRLPWLEAFSFQFLGVISYSLYLWHSIILTIDRPELKLDGFGNLVSSDIVENNSPIPFFLIYIPSIIFLSSISYLLIERPFLVSKTS